MKHLLKLALLSILLSATLVPELNMGTAVIEAQGLTQPSIIPSSLSKANYSASLIDHKDQERGLAPQQKLSVPCKGGIGEITFAPNGKVFAVGAKATSTVRLFEAATGQLLAELKAQDKWLSVGALHVQFSPDSQTVAVQNLGNKVRLWDVKTGTLKTTLVNSGDMLFAVAFSPDSQTIATASYEKPAINLWEVETGRLQQSIVLPVKDYAGGGVAHLAFSPNGKLLAASDYRRIFFWNTDSRKLIGTLIGHKGTIYRLAFSADGQTLATASSDETAKLWDVETHQEKATLVGHQNKVVNVFFSPDGRTLITESDNKVVMFWDATTSQLKMTLKNIRWRSPVVAFNPNGRLFATASDKENSIKLWDARTYQPLTVLPNMRSPMAFSPDGKTLATEGKDDLVILWNLP